MTLSLVAVMPACSDDGGSDDVDAGDVCEGHGCPVDGNPLERPEAGLLRAELYHTGNDADTGARLEGLGAWFFAFSGQQGPAARGVVGPIVLEGQGANVTCFDQTAHNLLVNGYSDENQVIADSRTYYDLGESITLQGEGGGTIDMARYTPDTGGNLDPTNALAHGVIYKSDLEAASVLERNSSYSLPFIGPVDGFPGLDLRGGFDIPGGANYSVDARPPAIFMPPDFTMLNPVEDGADGFYGADGNGWQIDSSQDLVMEWAINGDAEIPADWPTAAQFTAFASLDDMGRPTIEYICIGPAAAGTHTIPQGIFELPGFPAGGLALHATFTHTAWVNPGENDDDHHFSYMAVNCNMGGYALVAPL